MSKLRKFPHFAHTMIFGRATYHCAKIIRSWQPLNTNIDISLPRKSLFLLRHLASLTQQGNIIMIMVTPCLKKLKIKRTWTAYKPRPVARAFAVFSMKLYGQRGLMDQPCHFKHWSRPFPSKCLGKNEPSPFYMRLCISIRGSVRPSVRRSARHAFSKTAEIEALIIQHHSYTYTQSFPLAEIQEDTGLQLVT